MSKIKEMTDFIAQTEFAKRHKAFSDRMTKSADQQTTYINTIEEMRQDCVTWAAMVEQYRQEIAEKDEMLERQAVAMARYHKALRAAERDLIRSQNLVVTDLPIYADAQIISTREGRAKIKPSYDGSKLLVAKPNTYWVQDHSATIKLISEVLGD